MIKKVWLPILLILICISCDCLANIQCLNQQGHPVDWWVIIKMPKNSTPPTSGYVYFYTDPHEYMQLYSALDKTLDVPYQALGYTLNQIYTVNNAFMAWAMYNDEPPGIDLDPLDLQKYGHTKGVLAFDKQTGFWLLHSVPKFPAATSKTPAYYFPPEESIYGQSMMCMTFPTDTFEQLGQIFAYSHPEFYDTNIPSSMQATVPSLVKAIHNTGIVTDPADKISNLYTLAGMPLKTLSQSSPVSQANAYFYQFAANKMLQQSLYVESWIRGQKIGPLCSQTYKVNDVDALSCPPSNLSCSWQENQDHSKWAISEYSSSTVCIGDLNRMESQRVRGGNTVCFEQPYLHANLLFMIANQHSNCPKG